MVDGSVKTEVDCSDSLSFVWRVIVVSGHHIITVA